MQITRMRTEAGQPPIITAAADEGESPAAGASVEQGSGIVTAVVGSTVYVAAAAVVEAGEARGYVLAKRVRDGLRTLTLDPPAPPAGDGG
jgi:hypothetical protein